MKPREAMLLQRLILNENYHDYLIAETILVGLDRELLKPLSRHQNLDIANSALKLRIDCMELFSAFCQTYKKMYEELVEQTVSATCTGPKPDEDSPLTILEPTNLLPYWRTAYCRAKAFGKQAKDSAERLKAKRSFLEKENINTHKLNYHFTQYLNFISYWCATHHNRDLFVLLELKSRLIELSNQLRTESAESKHLPKNRTTEYFTENYEGENLYEI